MPQEINGPDRKTNVELVCVDHKRNIWIKTGFPGNQDTLIIDQGVLKNLSGPPYVFTVNELTLIDNKHPSVITVKDVTVIFMHGGREAAGKWMFSDFKNGYPVVETVKKVNQYLAQKGKKPIQVIMACNDQPSPKNIKVGDFPPGTGVVYAVGDSVGLIRAEMAKNGKVTAVITANDFWGIDNLVAEQQITILTPV